MEQKSDKIGIIMGSSKFNFDNLDSFRQQNIETKYGPVFLWLGERNIVLHRHGKTSNIPPHKINHRANILAFQKLNVNKIISFTSVGSLKQELKPTHIIMPDDYINFGSIHTYFDDEVHHIVPGLDRGLREEIFNRIKELQIHITLNGIYIQTQGPRLETKAEIQMLKEFGDVVGMTMATEATLAKELEISYANISFIDNYCHGLLDEPLTIDIIKENQIKNVENIGKILKKLV